MAAAAGVGGVVLTHHLPEADTEARFDTTSFSGSVYVGADLDRFVV